MSKAPIIRLREPNGLIPTPIYLEYNWTGNRLLWSTKLKALPGHFDNNRLQTGLPGLDPETIEEYKYINDQIELMIVHLQKRVYNRTRENSLTVKDLKSDLTKYFHSNGKEVKTLIDLAEQFIQICDKGKRRNKKNKTKPITENTIATYRVTLLHLRNLKEYDPNVDMNIETLGMDFHDSFMSYFDTIDYRGSSRGIQVKNIKSMMKYALDRKMTEIDLKTLSEFSPPSSESVHVFLDRKEIKKLINANLEPRFKRVIEVLIVACYTGQRYSDLHQLDVSQFKTVPCKKSKKEITIQTIRQVKTDERVDIYMNPLVQEILERHGGSFKMLSNANFNKVIKLACKEIGFTDPVTGIEKDFEKWELISSHTGRRSFATNLYIDGRQTETIMKQTGHKSHSAFMKYIKCDSLDHAEIISESEYMQVEM